MKYMGSKRSMLRNGLGSLLVSESASADRIVDLFAGSAAVSWFCASRCDAPILACDLQQFSSVLANSVISRTAGVPENEIFLGQINKITGYREQLPNWPVANKLDGGNHSTANWVRQARKLCEGNSDRTLLIWRAYGGHYFSPTQALTFDALLHCLPRSGAARKVAHAAIVIAASRCVASPGHTAQPFQPTLSAGRFVREAWSRDPLVAYKSALNSISRQFAKSVGASVCSDALIVTSMLNKHDLVFIDPPYSGVHYSRFYHVLETIARRACGPVTGVGRYPAPVERPVSHFSRKTEALAALKKLYANLAESRCRIIFTFPQRVCSNGLSGDIVEREARKHFRVTKRSVLTRFSTMGGNNSHRDSRQNAEEMILYLRPKYIGKSNKGRGSGS